MDKGRVGFLLNIKYQHIKLIVVAVAVSSLAVLTAYSLGDLWLWKFFGATRDQFLPNDHDSLCFWHEIRSMIQSPWSGGYYGWQELHSPVGGFGPRGVWLCAIYAIGGKLLGWESTSPHALNAFFLGLGISSYVILVRANWSCLVGIMAFCAFFGPLQSGLVIFTPDIFSIAIAFTVAGVVYRIINETDDQIFFWFLLFLSLFSTLVRKSWVLLFLFLPLFHYAKHRVIWKKFYISVIVICPLSLFALSIFSAPYPFGSTMQSTLTGSMSISRESAVIHTVVYSMTSIFKIYREIFYYNLFGLQLLAVSIVAATLALLRRNAIDTCIFMLVPVAMLFYVLGHLFNGVISFRHIAPFFVIIMFSAIIHKYKKLFVLVLLINVLLYPAYLQVFHDSVGAEYFASSKIKLIDMMQPLFKEYISVSEHGTRWCNTVLVDNYSFALLALPVGINFNFIRPDEFDRQRKISSRYLFLENIDNVLPLLQAPPKVLLKTKYGVLLENTENSCFNSKNCSEPREFP